MQPEKIVYVERKSSGCMPLWLWVILATVLVCALIALFIWTTRDVVTDAEATASERSAWQTLIAE